MYVSCHLSWKSDINNFRFVWRLASAWTSVRCVWNFTLLVKWGSQVWLLSFRMHALFTAIHTCEVIWSGVCRLSSTFIGCGFSTSILCDTVFNFFSCFYTLLKWILFLRSRFWCLIISHFDVTFDCFEEDIVTSILRTSFHIWLQKHSKIVFINRDNAKLLVAHRFKQWLSSHPL